jgi:hypothetical protein
VIVTLHSLQKSNANGSCAHYIATFRLGDKLQNYHATLRPREGNAIRFREPAIDKLLTNNIDQGRKVYRAILELYRGHPTKFPLPLGDLSPTIASRTRPSRARTMAHA